jgi:signal transduction histidine kinase
VTRVAWPRLRGTRRTTAIVWGGLAAFVLLVYVVVVLGGGALIGRTSTPHIALSVLATTMVALGFEPVQTWLETVASRAVHGGRRSPYDVLTRLADAATGSYPSEELPGRMALVLADGTGAEWTQVWLVVRGRLTLAATWPPRAAAEASAWDGEFSAPGCRWHSVRQAGELLGVLRLKERENEPLTPVEERLFAGLANQAGLVLRGVRLRAELSERVAELTERAEELTASRRRLVDTQDAERRRLERDIHDGAQQHLVALAVNLRLAQALTDQSPKRATQVLRGQGEAARETMRILRDLSRGIYPRTLSDDGIVAAVSAAATTSPLRVDVTGRVGRYPAEVEAAVYFCCLEAMQNSTKHAAATRMSVDLREAGDALILVVADDGAGFRRADTVEGEGIANMRDRIETVGGELVVSSVVGEGTTVEARVPLAGNPMRGAG